MDCLAVMAKRLLCKSFWISRDLGPFCPCVAVAMEADTSHADEVASLLEFSCTVARSNCDEVREQGSGFRKFLQDFGRFFPEMNLCQRTCFLSVERDGAIPPIDVLSM